MRSFSRAILRSVLKFSTKSAEVGYYVSELKLINVNFCKYINMRQ